MSMSTSVTGFKPPDDKWKKNKKAYEACQEAGIDVPDELQKFFGYEEPDPAGVEVSEEELTKCGALKEVEDIEAAAGFELLIGKLPADVKIIRFLNSW